MARRRSSYSRRNRCRFTFDQKKAQVRRLRYCALSHPLPIDDDWPNRDALADKCKITIYGFKDPPKDHIVEVEVDRRSRFSPFHIHRYLVKKFPSRNEALEFAESIQEPVSYNDLIDNGFHEVHPEN